MQYFEVRPVYTGSRKPNPATPLVVIFLLIAGGVYLYDQAHPKQPPVPAIFQMDPHRFPSNTASSKSTQPSFDFGRPATEGREQKAGPAMDEKSRRTAPPPPPGVPSWPEWTLTPGGHGLTISGRHLTPAGARLAWTLSAWATVAGLVFPGWYFWGFKNTPPDFLRVTLNAVSAQFFDHVLTFPERKWAYVGVWVVCWMLFRVWRRMIVAFLSPAFRRRSTVQFTADAIVLPRAGFRRGMVFNRRAVDPVTFVLQPDPDLPWRELTAQQKGTPALATFYRQCRHLFLQYGIDLVPVARFAAPLDADRFDQMCLLALRYKLEDVPPAGRPATRTITDV